MIDLDNTDLQGATNNDFKRLYLKDDPPGNEYKLHSCGYYEVDEFQKKVEHLPNTFSTLSMNIRSLPGKMTELNDLIAQLNYKTFKFSIICLQEVWNIPEYMNLNLNGYHPPVYKLRDPKNKRVSNLGGGIGIWVDTNEDFQVIDKFSIFQEGLLESCFIKLINKNGFKIVGNIYRPPGSNIDLFNNTIDNLLTSISLDPEYKKAEVVIQGYININLLNFENHTPTSDYLDILLKHGQL